jgi:hypothetical protein
MKKLILLFWLLSSPAWAADCPNPITSSNCGCRAVSASTTYTLSENMTCTSGTAIEIGAANVTLDGQGYSIDGDNSGSTGVTQYISGVGAYDGLTIQNLTVKNFINNNIKLSEASNCTLTNVTSTGATDGTGGDNWPYAGNGLLVFQSGTESGLTIAGGNYSGNIDGIHVIGNSAADKFTTVSITGTVASNNTAAGIYLVKVSGATISGVTANANGSVSATGEDYGVAFSGCDNCTLTESTITNTSQNDAVQIVSDATVGTSNTVVIQRTTINVSGGDCIGVGTDGDGTATGIVIRYNKLIGCANQGVNLSHTGAGSAASVAIYNNTITGNTGNAIKAESANFPAVLTNNIFSSNAAPDVDFSGSTAGLTSSYNLWYRASGNVLSYNGATYTTANITTFEATAITGNPLLDSSYHIGAASPAKDVGTPILTYAEMVALGLRVYGTAPDMGGSERVQSIDNFPALPLSMSQTFLAAASTSSAAYVQP